MSGDAVLADKIERLGEAYRLANGPTDAGYVQADDWCRAALPFLRACDQHLPAILSALRRPEPAAGDMEAVARAIYDSDMPGYDIPTWDDLAEDDRRPYRRNAHAVLAALPRPEADEGAVAVTDAMVEAALDAQQVYWKPPWRDDPFAPERKADMRKAISAALAAAQEQQS